jgi:hypothetical protein
MSFLAIRILANKMSALNYPYNSYEYIQFQSFTIDLVSQNPYFLQTLFLLHFTVSKPKKVLFLKMKCHKVREGVRKVSHYI